MTTTDIASDGCLGIALATVAVISATSIAAGFGGWRAALIVFGITLPLSLLGMWAFNLWASE